MPSSCDRQRESLASIGTADRLRPPRRGTACTLAFDFRPPLDKGLCFSLFFFAFELLIMFYTADRFSDNKLTQKSARIFELRHLDNIAPRARAQSE
jgi:hypothetical protein